MEDLVKASESRSDDSQHEIVNNLEFENENHKDNSDIIDHVSENVDPPENVDHDTDVFNGIASHVDGNESQNELEINDVQEEVVEEAEEEEEEEVQELNVEREQNDDDEDDSNDDDDDEEEDDSDNDDNNNNNGNEKDNDNDGNGEEQAQEIEEDTSRKSIISSLKVRWNLLSKHCVRFCSDSMIFMFNYMFKKC